MLIIKNCLKLDFDYIDCNNHYECYLQASHNFLGTQEYKDELLLKIISLIFLWLLKAHKNLQQWFSKFPCNIELLDFASKSFST